MKIFYSLLAVLFLCSCVDVLDIETQQKDNLLVIEGYITTQQKKHTIEITRMARYGSLLDGGFSQRVSGATVIIRDGEGKQYFLEETSNGVYQTTLDFMAEVGKSYSLIVNTLDGKRIISLPSEITRAPGIDSLSMIYKKLPSADKFKFSSGVEVYSHWQESEDTGDFYLWFNGGTFFIETYPEKHTVRDSQGNEVADPKDCCRECWVMEKRGDQGIYLFKDENSNGGNVSELVAFIEDDGLRFTDKYFVEIEQLTISREAFQFFKLLKEQLAINGSIFDPPPANIRGNFINLSEPDENVIGFFFAADVSTASGFIPRGVLKETQNKVQINDDCRVIENTTTTPPAFWK